MAAAQAAEKHGDEWGLILVMRDIKINSNLNPLTKVIRSSRSTEFKATFPWNISQMIMKIIPISMRTVITHGETGHLVLSLLESQWKLRQ